MHTYIINLQKSSDRRKNIKENLKNESELEYEFIEAVDGRQLSEKEIELLFNVKKAEKKSGWKVLPGEIGCTLSHQKCYKELISSMYNYVLILEDDVVIKEKISSKVNIIDKIMNVNEPRILLISGLFIFSKKLTIDGENVGIVKDAALTHSYCINKAAAQKLIEPRPYIRADDWRYLIHKDVTVYGLIPHLVNQDNFNGTTISNGRKRIDFCFFPRIREIFRSIRIHIYKLIGREEPRE